MEYDITPLVTADGTVTLVLATSSADFDPREHADAARRPELVITLAP